MRRRTIEQILNELPTDRGNSSEERPCWLLSADTTFPEDFPFPKVEPVASSVGLDPDNPAFVEVVTNLDIEIGGLTAMALADAFNRGINSKVMVFPSETKPNLYELVIASELLRQSVESQGLKELVAVAANHDIIRAIVPSILAEIGQDDNPADFSQLQQRVDKSVKSKLDLLKGNT